MNEIIYSFTGMKFRFGYVFLLFIICKKTRADDLYITSHLRKNLHMTPENPIIFSDWKPPQFTTIPQFTTPVTIKQFTEDKPTTQPDIQFTTDPMTAKKRTEIHFTKIQPKDDSNSTIIIPKKIMSSFENGLLKGIASVNIILAVTSLPLNIFVIKHFAKGRHISAILYHKNGIMDLMCGLGFLLQVPPIFDIIGTRVPMAMILTSYVVTTVAVRGSTFTNLVLSSVRCINIVSPFFQVKKRAIAISIILYLAIWTSIAGYDIYFFISTAGIEKYVYVIKTFDLKPELGFGLRTKVFGGGIVAYGNLAMFYYGIPVLLPCVLSVVLMAIQIRSLLKKRVGTIRGAEKNKAAENAKGSALTILLLTLIYVTTSLLSIIAWLAVYRDDLMVKEFRALNYTELGIVYISTSTSPLLCSTISPLTLLIRGASFRAAVRKWIGTDRSNNSAVRRITETTKVSENEL